MTGPNVANDRRVSDHAWLVALADYRDACALFQTEVERARTNGDDISPDVAASHAWAARALIEQPASTIVQIGQKVRAADNLVNLSQLYPGLPELILRDLFGMLGIESGDCRPLPPSLQ